MHKMYRSFICVTALLVMVCGLSLTGLAQSGKSLLAVPVVTLENWKHSTEDERYSFLVGFMSMLDIEQAWQGYPPLPVSKSINGFWIRGLSGVSVQEIRTSLDNYITAHPDEMNRPVLEIIGRLYIGPKLTEAEKKAANARYKLIKGNFTQ